MYYMKDKKNVLGPINRTVSELFPHVKRITMNVSIFDLRSHANKKSNIISVSFAKMYWPSESLLKSNNTYKSYKLRKLCLR